MCTVSFVCNKSDAIITSNRDEHISRPLAFEPREEILSGNKILYPKDPKAGGTWFAVDERQVVTVLLNGAFKRHSRGGTYRKSRGLILLEVISNNKPRDFVRKIDLNRIEPFTLVLWEAPQLIEFRWDGRRRYFKELDPQDSHIWSSTTLYDPDTIAHRETLFNEFMAEGSTDHMSLMNFHSDSMNDMENGLVINRSDGLKTFSITQVVVDDLSSRLVHKDLLKDQEHVLTLGKPRVQNSI